MSVGGVADRVPIPACTREIIQNIKEIAGDHSDDEVYAMLKECAMDPDETTQKLLLQDTFHEVKRKRGKRKEGPREPADPWWRLRAQGRGAQGGRGNFSSRHIAGDAGIRNTNSGKENGLNQGPDRSNVSSSSISLDTDNKSTSLATSSMSDLANGPTNMGNTPAQVSGISGFASMKEISNAEVSELGDVKFTQSDLKTSGSASLHPRTGSAVFISAKPSSASEVDASSSDPVLVPSIDTHNFNEVCTIKRVIGSHCTSVEIPANKLSAHDRSASEFSSTSAKGFSDTSIHGKVIKSQGSETNQPLETPQDASSGNRPSSNYSNHPQQIVVQNKEWKPKSIHVTPVQASATMSTSDIPTAEAVGQSSSVSHSLTLEETTSKLEKGLDELHLDRQHVIIPNHLQVPESERLGLSFGSFNAGSTIDKSHTSQSEIFQDTQMGDQPSSSNDIRLPVVEDYQNHPLSWIQIEENYSSRETGLSSISTLQEDERAKPEPVMAPDGPQCSVVRTLPSSTTGVVPQMLGSQFAPLESSESQMHDNTCVPGFVSVNLSISGPTLTTQTAGVVESSIAVPQQPVPVFRQTAGLHISHYPPNYIPYNQYYSPFYMPPHALNHFLSSAAFPQQPPSGIVYPTPAAAAGSTPVKYSVSIQAWC